MSAVQSQFFNISCTIPAVQSQLFNPSRSISAVQSQLFNPAVFNPAVQPSCLIQLFNLSCSALLFNPSFSTPCSTQLFNPAAQLSCSTQLFNLSCSTLLFNPGWIHLNVLFKAFNVLNRVVDFFYRLKSNGLKNVTDQQLTEVSFGVTINV